nr:uncharacterized protein LOC111428072 [Onthophagus taurus]
MNGFKRTLDSNFPIKWHEFTSKSGKNYVIQDIPDEYKEIVANYMVYGFTKEEPLFKFSYASTFPNFLNEAGKFWKKAVYENLSLVCLTTNENGEIQIAGANCMYIAREDEEKSYKNDNEETSSTLKVLKTHVYMGKKADAFARLNIKEYMKGMGLYVLPEFRGEGIGIELLKAREPLCTHLDLKASCTVFTSNFSQNSAVKAGFKDLYVISYEDLAQVNEELVFPGIETHTKSIKFMYKLYN